MSSKKEEEITGRTVPDFLYHMYLNFSKNGLFIPGIIGASWFVILLKLPGEEYKDLLVAVLVFLRDYNNLGWVLFLSSTSVFCVLYAMLRRRYLDDTERIGKEKSRLQSLLDEKEHHSSAN